MKLKIVLRFCSALVVSFSTLSGMLLAVPAIASADVISTPTHLIDEDWNYPTSGYNLTDTSVDMTPEANGPAINNGASDGYFYADEFYWSGSVTTGSDDTNKTGYMGLQSQGNDGNGNALPKVALISIYGATSSVAANSNISATCGDPSNEGYGCALHQQVSWNVGDTYRFDLSVQNANDGNGNEVLAAKYTDVNTNTTTQLGTVDVPTSWGLMQSSVVTFHERFSGPTDSCSDQMPSAVTFSNVTGVANSSSVVAQASNPISNIFSSSCTGEDQNTVIGNVVKSSYGISGLSYTSSGSTTDAQVSQGSNLNYLNYTVNDGESLTNNGTLGNVIVDSNGTLKGSGTTANTTIESGGTLAPGDAPTCLTVNGNLTVNGSYSPEIQSPGNTACTDYDQTIVTGTGGTINLTGGTLNVDLVSGFNPSIGKTFTIINNQTGNPVTGTFSGLAEGTIFQVGSTKFKITYDGNGTNSVILTVVNPGATPGVPDTGSTLTHAYVLLPLLAGITASAGLYLMYKKDIKLHIKLTR